MVYFVLRNEDGNYFAGWPARMTARVEDASKYWSMRGARTARTHLEKRLRKAGIPFNIGIYEWDRETGAVKDLK